MLEGTRFGRLLQDRGVILAHQLGKGPNASLFRPGRSASVVGTPTLSYGRYGQAATLGGAAAYTFAPFYITRGISFGIRFKHTVTTASMTLFDFPLSVGGGTLIYMRANEGGTGKLNIAGIYPFFNAVSSSSSFNDGAWHAAVGVYGGNSGTMNLYVDGKLEATSVGVALPDYQTDFPRVGAERWFGVNYSFYNGSVADPFVVKTILTQQECRLYYTDTARQGEDIDTVGKAGSASTKPWLYRRASSVSRPYLQVA